MSQTAPDYVQQHDILERRLFRLATTSDEDIESHVNRFFPLSLYLSISLSRSLALSLFIIHTCRHNNIFRIKLYIHLTVWYI